MKKCLLMLPGFCMLANASFAQGKPKTPAKPIAKTETPKAAPEPPEPLKETFTPFKPVVTNLNSSTSLSDVYAFSIQ